MPTYDLYFDNNNFGMSLNNTEFNMGFGFVDTELDPKYGSWFVNYVTRRNGGDAG
jgi:hypothetical protein